MILALLLSALTAMTPEQMREAKPGQAFLTVSPRLGLWNPSHPVVVMAHVVIPKPVENFYCPSVEIRIYSSDEPTVLGYAYTETVEGDCPPWTLGGWHRDKDGNIVDDPPTSAVPWSWGFNSGEKHFGLGPGQWVVEVVLRQGLVTKRMKAAVVIAGG